MDLDFDAILARAGASGLQQLALGTISPDPRNPRRVQDDDELRALADSIATRGVLQPITVEPANAQGVHVIRFGERRFRAAQRASLATIPAIIAASTSPLENVLDQATENDQRVDLAPSDMAHLIGWLSEQLNQSEIAQRLGRSRAAVAQYAAVNEMPEHLAALANEIGLRPLYDLFQLWKKDAVRVDAYLDAVPVSDITRASVSALARPEPLNPTSDKDRRSDPVPRDGSAPLAGEGVTSTVHRDKGKSRAPSPKPGSGHVHVHVRVGDRQGTLTFKPCETDDAAFVQFDDVYVPESVSLELLRIVAVQAV